MSEIEARAELPRGRPVPGVLSSIPPTSGQSSPSSQVQRTHAVVSAFTPLYIGIAVPCPHNSIPL